jgi:hypothetical protein
MLRSMIIATLNLEYVEETYDLCLECNKLEILGNGLCVTCWDAGIDAEDVTRDIFTDNQLERAA